MASETAGSPGGSRSWTFSKNALWNVIGQGGLAALALACTPYLLHHMGNDGYALYCLLGLVGGYLSFFTLAAGPATVKFVAELRGAGAGSRLMGSMLGLSLAMHLAGVALGGVLVYAGRDTFAASLFQIPPGQRGIAEWVLTCAALAAPFMSLVNMAVGMCQGMQRYDLASKISMLQSALILVTAVAVLAAGRHLRLVAAAFVAIQVSVAAAGLVKAFRLIRAKPNLDFSSPESAAYARKFVAYGLLCSIPALAYLVTFQFDKLFIGIWLPLAQLSYYLIPTAIMQKFGILPISLAIVTLPMFSEMQAKGDRHGSTRVYRKCSQLVLWLVVPGFVVLAVIAPQFLTLWLGSEFSAHGTWPMRLLLAGYAIYFLQAIPGNASAGVGTLRYNNAAGLSLAVLCCVFWWVLIPPFGITGAALGFFLAQLCSWLPFILWINSRYFGLSASDYLFRVCGKPCLAGLALLVVLWLCRAWLYSWPALFLTVFLGLASYFSVGYWMLDSDMRENLHTVLASLRGSFRRSLGL